RQDRVRAQRDETLALAIQAPGFSRQPRREHTPDAVDAAARGQARLAHTQPHRQRGVEAPPLIAHVLLAPLELPDRAEPGDVGPGPGEALRLLAATANELALYAAPPVRQV